MKEVFEAAEDFVYDYSHGWGSTPTYQLTVRLLGLEIIEPGFKKIRLNPNLYGLKFASVEMPTPYGKIICDMKEGEKPLITIPNGIQIQN